MLLLVNLYLEKHACFRFLPSTQTLRQISLTSLGHNSHALAVLASEVSQLIAKPTMPPNLAQKLVYHELRHAARRDDTDIVEI